MDSAKILRNRYTSGFKRKRKDKGKGRSEGKGKNKGKNKGRVKSYAALFFSR